MVIRLPVLREAGAVVRTAAAATNTKMSAAIVVVSIGDPRVLSMRSYPASKSGLGVGQNRQHAATMSCATGMSDAQNSVGRCPGSASRIGGSTLPGGLRGGWHGKIVLSMMESVC